MSMMFGASAVSQADEPKEDSTVTVEWVTPKKFRDVSPSNESRTKFRERILENLEAHFHQYAQQLPADQTLSIKVTDLDLAGRVLPASFVGFGAVGTDIRIVKDVDIPRITMSYELTDASGQIIKSEDVKLKDMSFLQNSALRYRNELLGYEKNMLDKWFKRTFTTIES